MNSIIRQIALSLSLTLAPSLSLVSAHTEKAEESYTMIMDWRIIVQKVGDIMSYLNVKMAPLENNERLYQNIKHLLLTDFIKTPMQWEIMETIERHNQEAVFMEEAIMSDMDMNIIVQNQIQDFATIFVKFGYAYVLLPYVKMT
jgi:hypothetical protein